MSLDDLRAIALERLREVLGGARRVALVNFPNHGNPGDPGLWLGSRSLLQSLGVRIDYQASHWSLDLAALDRAIGDDPVLINGGGNFGDLYAGQQETRMKLIAGWTGRTLIQLPQSIHFSDPANAAAVAEVIREHGAFTMMVRDEKSVQLSRDLLGIEPVLSPDHAFGLHPLVSKADSQWDAIWMAWAPGAVEFTPESQPIDPPAWMHVEDWFAGAPSAHEHFDAVGRLAWRTNLAFTSRWDRESTRRLWPVLSATFEPLARRWFGRGVDLVASAGIVVTNKLHGHIVSAMLGKQQVILDNSYGKVSATFDTWTHGLPGVHVAQNAVEALQIATRLRDGT